MSAGRCRRLDDAALIARLYRRPSVLEIAAQLRRRPDFQHVHRELARPGVTRQLLWEEYRAVHPEGIGYTAFCVHYQRWRRAQALVLRQNHLPGDKLFVDYAGQTVPITDRYTGEQRSAQIFVAVLGASNYTFAEATGASVCLTGSGATCARSVLRRRAARS